jgi:alpha-L-fucosidase
LNRLTAAINVKKGFYIMDTGGLMAKYSRFGARRATSLLFVAGMIAVTCQTNAVQPADAAAVPRPTAAQIRWQHDELGIFFHFDIEVFDRAYQTISVRGNRLPPLGSIRPKLFNPRRLDTNQWLRVAKSMGAKYAVFTAKHSSGFLMWPSGIYPYGVRQSPWRGGRGDVVRDFIKSCRKYAVAPGLYCSAGANSWWSLHEGPVGFKQGKAIGTPAAVRRFLAMDVRMYASLWKHAGPLAYIWFDGGVDPLGSRLNGLLRKYEPDAVCFNGPAGAPGGIARWSGNEHGFVGYPLWNTASTTDDQRDRGAGTPNGPYYIPVEANVPLRYHFWMWKSDTVNKILPLATLMKMYLHTVGRGSNFIVNANIDPDGRVPAPDARRLAQFGALIRKWFGTSLAQVSGRGDRIDLPLPHPTVINFVMIQEDISRGQKIRSYQVEGLVHGIWKPLCRGQSVGEKRIQQFDAARVSAIRLLITQSVGTPVVRKLAVFHIRTPWPAPSHPK